MAGNVAEWCNDWYDESYYVNLGNTKNPGGPLTGQKKVVRGGSWIDNAFFLRCTARNCYPPGTKREIIGFRVVRIPKN
jgi:sulfatase modifying factor 1